MNTDQTVNLSLFAENPDNPQTVTAEDFALLVESVRKLPHTLAAAKIAYVTDYVALDGTDLRGQRVVIAGNKRLRALKQLAQDHATSADGAIKFDAPLPAEWFFDLTPLGTEARKAWLVKSNIQSGEWDAEKLLALYDEEQLADLMGDDAIAELLRSVSEASAEERQGETDPDDVPEAPVETSSKRGEVYQLGNHRLMCGDSTSAEDVARLMGDERADIAFTSPPYNLMRTDILKALNSDRVHVSYDIRKGTYIHTRDDLSDEEYAALLIDSCRLCLAYCDEVFYNIGILSGSKQGFVRLLYEFRERLVDLICWKKNNFLPLALPAQRKMLGHPCEFIMAFGSGKRSFSHAQWELGAMTNCIETTTAAGNRFSKIHHGTMPVDFAKKVLLNFSATSVLDVFGGTGTTMIAAEQTGRRCLMMELDPHYCDVIRKRWAEFVHGEGCDWRSLTPATND